MGAAGCVAQTLALTTCPVPPALSRSTPGDKVHARGAPNSRGPRGGLWSNLGFLFVCSFVLLLFLFLSWCSLVPFILERREGGRVPRTACEPITYLPPSRPEAATRGAQTARGAGHAGSCSPLWRPSGVSETGAEGAWRGRGSKKERTEFAGIRRKTFANVSKLPGSRREGFLPSLTTEVFESPTFSVDNPADVISRTLAITITRHFPGQVLIFVGLCFLFTEITCVAYFA